MRRCGKAFRCFSSARSRHQRTRGPEALRCVLCGDTFSLLPRLTLHLSAREEKPALCVT